MNGATKIIENNVLAVFGGQMTRGVANAIQNASDKTGVDFAYLVQQANAESSFNPNAKAKTSSATGLFQFIESTWMNMMNKHGEKYGIDVENTSKRALLNMRKDPEIASNMAAEFASENEKFLQDHWAKGEKDIGSTELYLAHFLGASGAAGFLNARDENPNRQAAYIFPEAAAANKNVFYDRATGRARSFEEIYNFFDNKFQIKSEPAPQVEPVIAQKDEPAIMSEMLLAFGVENSGFEAVVQEQEYSISRVFQNGFRQENAYSGFEQLEGIYQRPVNPYQSLVHAPIEIMILADLDLPTAPDIKRHDEDRNGNSYSSLI